jgi:hypothetical protein
MILSLIQTLDRDEKDSKLRFLNYSYYDCGYANNHDHAAYLDGVFYRPDDDPAARLEFCPARPPAEGDIAVILSKVRHDVLENLRDRGMLAQDPAAESLADEAPLLLACTDASLQHLVALGPRQGKGPIRVGADPRSNRRRLNFESRSPLHTHFDGFDLHAEHFIAADDREGLERALRYATRPPFSEQRLSILPGGKVQLTLKNAWSDGTSSVLFSPLEFLERLASLIPRPEKNLLIYRGILAPNHKLRSLVIRFGRKPYSLDAAGFPAELSCPPLLSTNPQPETQILPDHIGPGPGQQWLAGLGPTETLPLQSPGSDAPADRPSCKRPNYTWATLMRRAYSVDVLTCPRPGCPGRLRYIATFTDPAQIDRIVASLTPYERSASGLDPPASGARRAPRAPPYPPGSHFGPLFDRVV